MSRATLPAGWPRLLPAGLLAALLSACATTPTTCMQPVGPGATLLPGNAAGQEGTVLTWGGRIIATHNLADHSLIEVESFPLDDCGRPRTGKTGRGRFLVQVDGFLEPENYAPGRLLTATGRLAHPSAAESHLATIPVHTILSEAVVRLWPLETPYPPSAYDTNRPLIGIGIGGGFGGGSSRLGGGIGIHF